MNEDCRFKIGDNVATGPAHALHEGVVVGFLPPPPETPALILVDVAGYARPVGVIPSRLRFAGEAEPLAGEPASRPAPDKSDWPHAAAPLCEPSEVTLACLEACVSNWEQAVSSIARGWECYEAYALDVFEREELQGVLNGFALHGLTTPESLQMRIDGTDRHFLAITEPGHCVRSDRQIYDPEMFWFCYRWPRQGYREGEFNDREG